MTRARAKSESESRCEKCGSRAFLVDETCTHVVIDGEIVKTHPGDLSNRNCIRCTYPDLYPDFRGYDDE